MDIVGIDIAKAKLDAALLVGARFRQSTFGNTEAGFQQLLAWLAGHRPDRSPPVHACMEATGNWGLDLADALHSRGVRVSIVNPARIKAYGESELARDKTDRRDAALIARFCRTRAQELNRQKAGAASAAVAASIAAHLDWLDQQIEAVLTEVRRLIEADPGLGKNLALVRSITGFGEISAAILLAELPNIAEFTPKAPAAFAGLSPSERSSGTSVRRSGSISRIGSERPRRTLFMRALSAKRANNRLTGFVQRPTAAGKPPKVILLAVARKLLVYPHAVIRTRKPFTASTDAPLPA
jgi:transposase